MAANLLAETLSLFFGGDNDSETDILNLFFVGFAGDEGDIAWAQNNPLAFKFIELDLELPTMDLYVFVYRE